MLGNSAARRIFKIIGGCIYLLCLRNLSPEKFTSDASEIKHKNKTQRGFFATHHYDTNQYSPVFYQNTGNPPFGLNPCEQGTCIAREECLSLGGNAGSSCFAISFRGGVCCLVRSCSNQTTERSVSFINPNYPRGEKQSINCEMSMVTKPTTCAVRIDFHETRLTPAVRTSCYEDSVTILVNPSMGKYNTPFCGYLNGYSTILETFGVSEVKIIVITQSYGAYWRIQLTQVECTDIKLPDETACGIQTQLLRKNGNTLSSKENRTVLQQKVYMYTRKKNEIIRDRVFTQPHSLSNKRPTNEKIFNGQEVLSHRYPWMALLMLDSSIHCSASLLTQDWLLTAGHCTALSSSQTPPIKRLTVLLGAYDISSPDSNTLTKSLSNIVRHSSLLGVTYDIALLKLSESIQYSTIIRPICLPTAGSVISPASPIIAGWGLTGNGMTSVLMESSTLLINRATCQGAWRKRNVSIADYMICTTSKGCNGDSGGPLMVKDENEIYYVIGIISFGAQMCGDPTVPLIHTKVYTFLQWIAIAMAQNTPS